MPDRCPAYIRLGGLPGLSRWMPPGSSEWMIAPAARLLVQAAFCLDPSHRLFLEPHQSAHTETMSLPWLRRSAILYDSTA